MDQREVAAAIGNEIDAYRTYSGTKKWWRAVYNDLTWKVSLDTDKQNLVVTITPRPELPSSKSFILQGNLPEFISNNDEVLKFKNSSQFVEKASKLAKNSLNERIVREIIREEISKLL